ncbi:hypothetical protein ACFXI8_23775 [Streptomyces niveus]|uniref:hypothetical protein n=1 Tax=Streptomyces niveus TaxID=193462 RepID=UPI0036A4E216
MGVEKFGGVLAAHPPPVLGGVEDEADGKVAVDLAWFNAAVRPRCTGELRARLHLWLVHSAPAAEPQG